MLAYDEVAQDQHRRDDAMLLDENRLRAGMRATRYQQALRGYHNHRVHARCFEEQHLTELPGRLPSPWSMGQK